MMDSELCEPLTLDVGELVEPTEKLSLIYRYMSTLYSHPDFPAKGPKEINEELRKCVSHNPLKLLTPQKVKRYIEALWKKKRSGQPVTFTDIFGMLIGETLIQNVCLYLYACESCLNLGADPVVFFKAPLSSEFVWLCLFSCIKSEEFGLCWCC